MHDSHPTSAPRPSADRSTPPFSGLVVLAALVVAAAGLKTASSIVGPVFLVLTLAITVHPLRTWMRKHRVPALAATVVALLAVYVVLLVVLGSVVWCLVRLTTALLDYGPQLAQLLTAALDRAAELGLSRAMLENAVSSLQLSNFAGVAQQVLNGLTSGLSLLALMLATVAFVVVDGSGFAERLDALRGFRPRVADAFTDFASSVRRYWVVTTIFGLAVAVLDVVGLEIIGVPLAFTWGLLAFVTNYIPNVGFLLGLVPPTLIALLENGPGSAVAVLVVYIVLNVVIQGLVQPRFTGDAVGLTGTVAFLSLIVWAFLLGALGALLAVPATLFVKLLLVDHTRDGRWVGTLISSTVPHPPPGRTPVNDS
ncbi:Predicted PurR-regulated permease PerM [Microlunatus sagamiharensis]|uniref:Predicted PurR-regulated permease PerM n=1 Tax=Microlunatus sagamiharensis TaxID=546874 RepID=A0A1H2LR43_9ACTN|nr:AI-2E family transporter [Microlunatus sagamiharensis]SDU83324.1 Predicted PurR-regulated permease PerM [Microlunatus sagamiharensis]